MHFDRRQILFAGVLSGISFAASGSRGRSSSAGRERALVIIELQGGNDGLNTLVPREDDLYFRARPTLAIPKTQSLALGDLDALHPALAKLRARFDRGELAIVRGVGHTAPNLSHFKSQDIWATASTADVPPPLGWVGRLHHSALELGRFEPSPLALVAVGRDTPPAAFNARRFVAPAMEAFEDFRESADAPAARATELGSERIDALELARDSARDAGRELERAASVRTLGAYPATSIGAHLRMAAQIRVAGLATRVVWITTPSFDTHTRQAHEHEVLLARLDAALEALFVDLASARLLESTTVVTVSEFGRRVRESGVGAEAGTDHGTASVMLVAGGAVRGGVYGERERLDQLDENGNLRATTDFRAVLASLIEDGFGVDASSVLPEPRAKLDLLRKLA